MAKVLVIDGSELFRELVADWLRERGHGVAVLDSASHLVSSLRRERPDMILVDVDLPGLSGPRVAAVIRDGGLADCPVILSCDRHDPSLAMLCVECGASGYVIKGADGNSFMRAFEAHMPRRSLIPGELMPRMSKFVPSRASTPHSEAGPPGNLGPGTKKGRPP
jgi:DNA-binding response OmpR family regulator